MTKEKMWELLVTANPEILDESSRLTPESALELFNITWNRAYEAGAADMGARYSEIGVSAETEFVDSLGKLLNKLTSEGENNESTETK